MKRSSAFLAPGFGRTIHHYQLAPSPGQYWAAVAVLIVMVIGCVL